MGGASCVTIIIEKVIPARSDICPCFKLTKSQEKNKEYILKLAKQIQFLCEQTTLLLLLRTKPCVARQ